VADIDVYFFAPQVVLTSRKSCSPFETWGLTSPGSRQRRSSKGKAVNLGVNISGQQAEKILKR
jgi:hypothetical protein